MKLAANLTLLYPGLPLEERIALAERDGFEGVEILFPYDITPRTLHGLLNRHGLTLALINTPPGPGGEKGLACLPGREEAFRRAMQAALDICQETGCRIVHAMAGMPGRNADRHACRRTLVENLRHAAPLAAKAGVTLTLEALNRLDMPGYFYYLPEQAVDIIREVGEDAVRLQFDLYHCQREGLDLVSTLHAVWPWVRHVQFAHPQGRHEPDLSDPQVKAALRWLVCEGYAGWVGCEYVPREDARSGLAWRSSYDALLRKERS